MILLFGSNGWIGSKVIHLLKEKNIPIVKATSRADDVNSIRKEIQESQTPITHII